jgi:hypothetical protein
MLHKRAGIQQTAEGVSRLSGHLILCYVGILLDFLSLTFWNCRRFHIEFGNRRHFHIEFGTKMTRVGIISLRVMSLEFHVVSPPSVVFRAPEVHRTSGNILSITLKPWNLEQAECYTYPDPSPVTIARFE